MSATTRFARWLALVCLIGPAGRAAASQPDGRIEGTVKDRGVAVAGALVAAIPSQSWSPAVTAYSDRNGHYVLPGLPRGTYGITATARDHTAGFKLGVPVERGVTRVELDLGGEAVLVRGTVRDRSGSPIHSGRVVAARVSDSDGDLFVVDVVDGRYEVRLPQAQYRLIVGAPHFQEDYGSVDHEGTTDVEHVLSRGWPPGPAPASVVDWFRATALPLTTVEPGTDAAELRALRSSLHSAKIIGVGEPTLGAHDLFRLKHRLFEWLVKELGFRVLALEVDMAKVIPLDEYLRSGRGDPEEILAGLGAWNWNTAEAYDLVQWIRRWNVSNPHAPIHVYGIDIQSPSSEASAALGYLSRREPAAADQFRESLKPLLLPNAAETVSAMTPAARRTLVQNIRMLLDRLDNSPDDRTGRTASADQIFARRHARVLAQFMSQYSDDLASRDAARDHAMSENVEWILNREGPSARMMIWAHNSHVSLGDGGRHPMGQDLQRRWPKQYVSLGLVFDHGSFAARSPDGERRMATFDAPPMAAGSLDQTLEASGRPLFLVDLRSHQASGEVSEWLSSRHATHDIGAEFSPTSPLAIHGNEISIAGEFDLIAFVSRVSPVKLLGQGSRVSR